MAFRPLIPLSTTWSTSVNVNLAREDQFSHKMAKPYEKKPAQSAGF